MVTGTHKTNLAKNFKSSFFFGCNSHMQLVLKHTSGDAVLT